MTRFFFVKVTPWSAFVPSKYQYVAPQPFCVGSDRPVILRVYSKSFRCITQCGEWNIGDVQHSRHHRKATDAEMEHWLGQVAPEMNWKDVNAFLYQFGRNTFDLDKFRKKIL